MGIRILRETTLSQLRGNIGGNIERYSRDEPWLEEVFDGTRWSLDTRLQLPDDFEFAIPDTESSYDLENSRNLFMALKELTPIQAADERLWAYLAHTVGWRYMRSRWDVDKFRGDVKKRQQYIRDRYFFMPNRDRALVRNGIARLWTYAYVTYDESREDPFELTAVMLQKLDIAQQLLERSFSRVPHLPRAVIEAVRAYPQNELDLTDRAVFRDIVRHINRVGGVTILDFLDPLELQSLVQRQAAILASRSGPAPG